MIQIKPHIDHSFICPKCEARNPLVHDIRFESINILADCTCRACEFNFYQTFPVGHTTTQTLSLDKESNKLYQHGVVSNWLAESFLKSHAEMRRDDVVIEKIVYKKYDKVVILNTLDSIYGHVLLKLYNAFYHLDQPDGIGLIIIIPRIFQWLIPKGCAEAWIVDLPLNDLAYGYDSIQKFVSHEIMRFQQVYLSKAYSHPNIKSKDVERLTGVTPFNLEIFYERVSTITFILREDRWWFTHAGDYWFYRFCRKFRILSWGSRILSLRQNRLVKRVIRLIRKELPNVNYYVVGLGKTGSFKQYATDERQIKLDPSIETTWCHTYSKSHVVIGVHGSNMLLPTALAAGCVEILPEDRYGNMVQDITVRYNSRLQLFFYRFVDQYANPKSISSKAIGILRDYQEYFRNMQANVYPTPTMTYHAKDDDAGHCN